MSDYRDHDDNRPVWFSIITIIIVVIAGIWFWNAMHKSMDIAIDGKLNDPNYRIEQKIDNVVNNNM